MLWKADSDQQLAHSDQQLAPFIIHRRNMRFEKTIHSRSQDFEN